MSEHQLSLAEAGAELHSGAALDYLAAVEMIAKRSSPESASTRLFRDPDLKQLCSKSLPLARLLKKYGKENFKPVRAILFNKSEENNWPLAWHQDRTICVAERHNADGFGPWSVKSGMVHVEPPFAYLERMLTVRIHLDDVPNTNAPLKIAIGSHLMGKVTQSEISRLVDQCETLACTARRGDIWVYSTPVIHSSEKAETPSSRRVLQIDFSSDELPDNLEWAGI